MAAPEFGKNYDGYLYRGGDPNDENSWVEASRAETYDPTEGASGTQKFVEGVGSGMVETGRKATNLLLPEGLTPEWASDEAIAEQRELDDPLLSTGPGMVGNIVGATAATAPIGGGVARALPKALGATSLAGRTAGSGLGRTVTQGGVEGAVLNDPGERVKGAVTAAGIGGTLGGGAKLFGKTLRGAKNVLSRPEKSAAAATLEREISEEIGEDVFIPASQAMDEGLMKQLYENVVANIPIAGQKLRGQLSKAQSQFDEAAVAKIVPEGMPGKAVVEAGDSLDDTIMRLDNAWASAFDDIADTPVMLAEKSWRPNSQAVRLVSDALDEAGSSVIIPPAGKFVKGRELLDLKQATQEVMQMLPKGKLGATNRKQLIDLRNMIDDQFRVQFNPSGKGRGQYAKMYNEYKKNLSRYGDYLRLKKAVGSKGAMSPKRLFEASKRGTGQRELGRLGEEALADFPSRQGIFQTAAALGIAGGVPAAIGAVAGESPAASAFTGIAGTVALATAMANPKVQRILMRVPKEQRQSVMEEIIRRIGAPTRTSVVATEEANR